MTMYCSEKNSHVRLEEALAIAGTGWYTAKVMVVTGLVLFAALLGMQSMSIVIPAAGCELQLSEFQKGLLTSMAFSGMIFSSHLFGFLADSLGRKRVMMVCNFVTVCLTTLSSLSPNALALMVLTFINGFMLGGVFTPAYVYVSEFCEARVRARGLLVGSAISSLAASYLACVAWIIMPLEISQPIYGGLVFTSWRLYLALLAVPNLITCFLLRRLPETPKYLLNEGHEEETLQILRIMYSVNKKKNPEDYPVQRVSLDEMDERARKETGPDGTTCMRQVRAVLGQAAQLFCPPYLLYTLGSCAVLFGIVGTYNSVVLWIPEHTRRLMLYDGSRSFYNATICEVMAISDEVQDDGLCQVDYGIFISSLVIGVLQSVFFLVTGLVAHMISSKILIVLFCLLTAGACFTLTVVRSLLLTLFSMGSIVVMLLTTFPLCLSIAVDFFPTTLRSTATSMIMLFGRIGAAAGSQVMGSMFRSHCVTSYWIMISTLMGVIILCVFIPAKRK